MENAIVIDGLKKEYGKRAAVKAISLNVEQGTLFSLLGVNGAGKTTTIKMLTGLTRPTSGEAYVMGRSINTELAKVKKLVSVSPQETAVAPNLTVRENLEFIAGIYGIDRTQAKEKTDELVREFSMEEVDKSKARRELWQIINSVKKNVTIVLTTHYMEEAEKLSDKVAVMVKGEVKAVGTVSELLQRTGKQNLEEAFVSIVGVE